MTPKVVVFDIGNVLIEWLPERFYDDVIGAERRRAMFSAVDLQAMNDDVDRGAHFGDSVRALAAQYPDWHPEIMMWHDRWIEMACPVIDHSVRLMKALQANKIPVVSLTNFGIETYDLAAIHYPFLRAFDGDYISGHMQVTKPDAQIYALLEEGTGLNGDAVIFTDDRVENIEAAATRGWQTHHFEGPQGWADRLVESGLLTREQAL
ncbi:haloacid dehalogenase [Sulfitobacter sp. SK012]|uniref:HAD-IA family hydrolase n=1 Tax=Sulfitobacter sp. SK012 TaxID=1389005 RepID=UPI000E0AD330|nr:HAD-IA family hydrolase [Sulfitobacter sp. SK012]AXI44855.1 haloacid dehalogenase [Sulfitobacter sp. SK012]